MNRPVHFEIHASDPEKLSAFYAAVFGWKIQHFAQMDYWLIDTGEGPGINGGILRRRGPVAASGQPVNAFVLSLGVESVDASFASALTAGATEAVAKHAISGIGYQAYIKDLDGNILGLHQSDPKAA